MNDQTRLIHFWYWPVKTNPNKDQAGFLFICTWNKLIKMAQDQVYIKIVLTVRLHSKTLSFARTPHDYWVKCRKYLTFKFRVFWKAKYRKEASKMTLGEEKKKKEKALYNVPSYFFSLLSSTYFKHKLTYLQKYEILKWFINIPGFFQNIRIEESASGTYIIQYVLHSTKHRPFKYFCVYVYFIENTFIKVVTIIWICRFGVIKHFRKPNINIIVKNYC